MYDVVIVGGGPAGISSLIWCHRLGLKTVLLERNEKLGGSLFSVNNPIVDYPGVLAANGCELQEKLVNHVDYVGCHYECGVNVERFHLAEKQLTTTHGDFRARALILCLGAVDRKLGVPGEAAMIARKEVYSASRDKDKFAGKNVVVVGGGDRAVEGALLLAEHGAHVTLIHRNTNFRSRKQYIEPVRSHPRIQVLTNRVITDILGDNRVEAVSVETVDGLKKDRMLVTAEAVFIRIGVEPNTRPLQGQLKTDADGYIRVNEAGETSMRNVFAVGDLRTRPLYSSVAGAVAQGMIVSKTISIRIGTGERT